jgi:hypothetical protein
MFECVSASAVSSASWSTLDPCIPKWCSCIDSRCEWGGCELATCAKSWLTKLVMWLVVGAGLLHLLVTNTGRPANDNKEQSLRIFEVVKRHIEYRNGWRRLSILLYRFYFLVLHWITSASSTLWIDRFQRWLLGEVGNRSRIVGRISWALYLHCALLYCPSPDRTHVGAFRDR